MCTDWPCIHAADHYTGVPAVLPRWDRESCCQPASHARYLAAPTALQHTKRLKVVTLLTATHLRATERHLPFGMAQCYATCSTLLDIQWIFTFSFDGLTVNRTLSLKIIDVSNFHHFSNALQWICLLAVCWWAKK